MNTRTIALFWLSTSATNRLIGVGRYDRYPDTDDAEVAFLIEDAHQRRGLGSVLLEHLAAAARERGSPSSWPRC